MTIIIPLLTFIICGFVIWQMRVTYQDTIQHLTKQNTALLDRLLTKNQMPPAAIDLVQRHEEREQNLRQALGDGNNGRRRGQSAGPVEQWTQAMTLKDLKEAERSRR